MNSGPSNRYDISSFRHINKFAKLLLVFIPLTVLLAGISNYFIYTSNLDNLAVNTDVQKKTISEIASTKPVFYAFLYIITIITIILAIYWTYRGYRNLYAFGAKGLSYSPTMAVVWWFIPIINLWKAFYVLKDMWKVSSINRQLVDGYEWKDVPYSNVIKYVWISFILFWFLNVVEIFSPILYYVLWYTIAIVLSIFTMFIIKQITSYQEIKFSRMFNNT